MTNKKQIKVTRGAVKGFRKGLGWSAARLGIELGSGIEGAQYSRSYVKSIEGGSLPLSRFFCERFALTRARVIGEQLQNRNWLIKGRAPKRLVIGKVRRCDVCEWHFCPSTPNQKRCGPACSKIARQRTAKAHLTRT
jgi:hypothetical protein